MRGGAACVVHAGHVPHAPRTGGGGQPAHIHLHAQLTGAAEEQRPERPPVGGQDAQRDQRVHGGRPVPQVGQRRPVKRKCSPHHHGGGQCERNPLPASELPGRHHRDHHDRQGQRGRDPKANLQVVHLCLGGGVISLGRLLQVVVVRWCGFGAVAQTLNHPDEVVDGEGGRVTVDVGRCGGVVHRGGDTDLLVQRSFDLGGATGTRHAADRQLGGVEGAEVRRCGVAGFGGKGVSRHVWILSRGSGLAGPWRSTADEARNGCRGLVELDGGLVAPGGHGMGDAMVEVLVQQVQCDGLQRPIGG